MDGAVRDEQEIVLLYRERLDKALDIHRCAGLSGMEERVFKLLWINAGLEAQVNTCPGDAIQDVVAFILGEGFAKLRADILRAWVALDRQVSTVQRVEEIVADGKLEAEIRGALTQHRLVFLEHQGIK